MEAKFCLSCCGGWEPPIEGQCPACSGTGRAKPPGFRYCELCGGYHTGWGECPIESAKRKRMLEVDSKSFVFWRPDQFANVMRLYAKAQGNANPWTIAGSVFGYYGW